MKKKEKKKKKKKKKKKEKETKKRNLIDKACVVIFIVSIKLDPMMVTDVFTLFLSH